MKILFLDANENTLFSFRKELLDTLIEKEYDVVLGTKVTPRIQKQYADKVCKLVDLNVNLKSKNVFSNLSLKRAYKKIIKQVHPDLIISFTIKPNLYAGRYAKNIPMIANITGLGQIFSESSLLKTIGIRMYKKSFKNISHVFFQNIDSLEFFKKHNIPTNQYTVVPGSGVNLERFKYVEKLPDGPINFLYASRKIREKGYDLLLSAIPTVLKEYDAVFNFLCNESNLNEDDSLVELKNKYPQNINIFDRSLNMEETYLKNHFIVSPSFYKEGISNILLESLACGRPIITTKDNPGCKEVLQDRINGYGVISNDLASLIEAIKKACNTPIARIHVMGLSGRKYVEQNFDRNTVIAKYLKTIEDIERAH